MTIRRLIIEVEEGYTRCANCPFDEYRCFEFDYIHAEMDCSVVNLATMKIKEMEEI